MRSAREANQDDLISENSHHDRSKSEEEAEFNDMRAQEIFDDWIVSLRLNQCQMLAIISMESFKNQQGMKVKDATKEAGSTSLTIKDTCQNLTKANTTNIAFTTTKT